MTTTTTKISDELSAIFEKFKAGAPEFAKTPILAMHKALETHDTSAAIKEGAKFPSFSLSNPVGETVTSESLLAKGPFVITFYRGEWCPFCNIAMAGLQARLGEIQAKGVTLVAVTPELPNGTLTMTEKHALQFPVLTDLHNQLARELGIVYKQPDDMRPVFEKFGNDMAKRNGDDSLEVPYPAAFLVARDGTVLKRYIEADYTKRIEPQEVVDWVNAL